MTTFILDVFIVTTFLYFGLKMKSFPNATQLLYFEGTDILCEALHKEAKVNLFYNFLE